ncbi:unnamed protein product [Schistocephalus solidus]|uniref:Uncharacterized protein n=1 Tax=Schistocephalus solidus TaxID=70667 RepID=A0A183SGG4_SCHSO|nr:unnamed protein product [Schistocephalus solidus]
MCEVLIPQEDKPCPRECIIPVSWQSQEHRKRETTQVAGAVGAAPGRTTTPGSDPTEWECHNGHIKKEPLQPDSQTTSQPLQTTHIGLTHGVDAGDSGPLEDFRVRDPVLSSQLQYSAEAAEMEVIQLPDLVRVDGPGLRSAKECRQDDGLVHLQFGVQVNTTAIPHGGLQPAESLTGFGNPLGNLFIDSRVA